MSESLGGPRAAESRSHREGLTVPRREHLGRHRRGQSRSRWYGSMEIVSPIMGVAHWDLVVEIVNATSTVRFEEGWPVAIDGRTFGRPGYLVMEANGIGGCDGLGMSDEIENRIIEAKSPPASTRPWRSAWRISLRAAAHRHPQREHAPELRHHGPPGWLALDQGRWVHLESLMLREPLMRVGGGRHGRGDGAPAARRRLLDPRHDVAEPHRRARLLSTSRWRTRRSCCSTHWAARPCATSTSPTRGNKLGVYRRAGTLHAGDVTPALDPQPRTAPSTLRQDFCGPGRRNRDANRE